MHYTNFSRRQRWYKTINSRKLLLISLLITLFFNVYLSSMNSIAPPAEGIVKLYPPLTTATASSIYSVTVNNKPVFVEKYNSLSYVQFAFAGTADIEIKVKEKVNNYKISPKSYKLQSRKQGNKISFSLTVPRKLILHHVNSLNEKLFILADPWEENPPQLGDHQVTNIINYQVDNTGKINATDKIQQAIDDVAEHHGILYFPAGVYKTRQLNLKSNVTLYLAAGAVLAAITEEDPSHGRGLLQLENVQNVKIIGRGTINGNGSYWRPRKGWYTLILLKNAKNIWLQDILLKDPAVANVWMSYSDNVTIDNLKILANPEPEFLNTDGFDFWSSRNITINNILYAGTDDATSHGGDRESQIHNNENINVRNSVFYNGNGFKISATKIPNYIKNITYENIDVVFANELSGFWPISGGYFENIYFKNIRVEDILDTPEDDKSARLFSWQIRVSLAGDPDSSPERFGHIRNVFINNVTADDRGGAKSVFLGYDAQRDISNVVFDNLCIEGKKVLNPQDAYFDIKNQYVQLKFTSSNPTIVNIKASALYASQGNAGQFRITRTGDKSKPLTVKYTIRGTAKNGKDYQKIPGAVTIPVGVDTVAIAIQPQNHNQRQRLKTVLLSLENQPNSNSYMLSPNFQAVVNIRQ
ncbi:hypothetical protein H6G64_19615 [Calothrix sp. FACHB-156]|nr:hypothetical protein [Calothrix sp. FACHB-156]